MGWEDRSSRRGSGSSHSLICQSLTAVASAASICPASAWATAISSNGVATEEHRALVERIFRAVGVVCFVDEEAMDAVTALSGSGPAYVYMVIEALIAGGLKMGLSHDVATRLAEQTVLGAARLVKETGIHPAILRDQVITPGGVTISAIHELERHGLRAMLISAVETATNHSRARSRALLEQHKAGD